MSSATPVTFASVRRMSSSKISKLNKEQLAAALKDAIATAETPKAPEFTLTAKIFQDYLDRAMQDLMTKLTLEFSNKIEDMLHSANCRILTLEEELDKCKQSCSTSDVDLLEEKIIDEVRNIESRKNNVIIFGLKESDSLLPSDRKFDDNKHVTDIAVRAGVPDLQFRDCYRIGVTGNKPRPLKLVGLGTDKKIQIFRKACRMSEISNDSNLGRIFIKNDLTPRQQKQERQVLAVLGSSSGGRECHFESRQNSTTCIFE